jgi:hypothetical protein
MKKNSESVDAMAQRLGCDRIFVAVDHPVMGKAGDVLTSAEACQRYRDRCSRVGRPSRERRNQWIFWGGYAALSPFVFVDVQRIGTDDIVMTTLTLMCVAYAFVRARSMHRLVRAEPVISEPVAGIEHLFDEGTLQRRWVPPDQR